MLHVLFAPLRPAVRAQAWAWQLQLTVSHSVTQHTRTLAALSSKARPLASQCVRRAQRRRPASAPLTHRAQQPRSAACRLRTLSRRLPAARILPARRILERLADFEAACAQLCEQGSPTRGQHSAPSTAAAAAAAARLQSLEAQVQQLAGMLDGARGGVVPYKAPPQGSPVAMPLQHHYQVSPSARQDSIAVILGMCYFRDNFRDNLKRVKLLARRKSLRADTQDGRLAQSHPFLSSPYGAMQPHPYAGSHALMETPPPAQHHAQPHVQALTSQAGAERPIAVHLHNNVSSAAHANAQQASTQLSRFASSVVTRVKQMAAQPLAAAAMAAVGVLLLHNHVPLLRGAAPSHCAFCTQCACCGVDASLTAACVWNPSSRNSVLKKAKGAAAFEQHPALLEWKQLQRRVCV